MSQDIYQVITDRFIEQLEKGTVPWQKPWLDAQNGVSGKSYRGINALVLGMSQHQAAHWLSFKQVADLGGQILRGEKATPIIYWKMLDKKDQNGQTVLNEKGEPVQIPFIRWSNIFNLDQTKGIALEKLAKVEVAAETGKERAESILKSSGLKVVHAGDRAFYNPTLDFIAMPGKAKFAREADYYQTLFHEMTHATGHSSRLNREGITEKIAFGSERYAKEELIAELGAAFLMNDCKLLGEAQFENASSYFENWVRTLQENPKILIQAAAKAQQAHDFLCGERIRFKTHSTEAEKGKMAMAGASREAEDERE